MDNQNSANKIGKELSLEEELVKLASIVQAIKNKVMEPTPKIAEKLVGAPVGYKLVNFKNGLRNIIGEAEQALKALSLL